MSASREQPQSATQHFDVLEAANLIATSLLETGHPLPTPPGGAR